MKRIVPRPLPQHPLPETAQSDVARIVSVAAAGGYVLDPEHAVTIWRQHSTDALGCIWSVPGSDPDILDVLARYGAIIEQPTPPDGHNTWLDYAVAAMDTRSLEIDQLLADSRPATRQQMDAAVQAELANLRARAR